MSKPRLAAVAKPAPQKTDAERLESVGHSLERMAEHLNLLRPHLTDLSNLLYEWRDLQPGANLPVVQAAEILLEEYARSVEDFVTWAKDLAAEAAGTEQK